jgi:hypothetical protein
MHVFIRSFTVTTAGVATAVRRRVFVTRSGVGPVNIPVRRHVPRFMVSTAGEVLNNWVLPVRKGMTH